MYICYNYKYYVDNLLKNCVMCGYNVYFYSIDIVIYSYILFL